MQPSSAATLDVRLLRSPVLTALLRWRYAVVVIALVASWAERLQGTGKDWRFFYDGTDLLFGVHRSYFPLQGGLHLYANYPEYQIGPLSLVASAPFHLFGPVTSRWVASVCMTAAFVGVVVLLERTSLSGQEPSEERTFFVRLTVLLGGSIAAVAWAPLSTIYAHLDDVIVLASLAVSLWAIRTRHPLVLGLAMGAAIAAKPWGIVALPLAFALKGRDRRLALVIGGALAAVAWLPFVVADAGTLDAAAPQVRVSGASVLHLLGVPKDVPTWMRLVQLAAMFVLALLAVWRGRWAAAPFVGVVVRVGLDPRAFLYYSAGVIVLALAWDLLRTERPLPLWTLVSFVLLDVAYAAVDVPELRAALRLVLVAAVLFLVLFARSDAMPSRKSSDERAALG